MASSPRSFYSTDLLGRGLDDDTNTNLIRRMLLVLESVAACNGSVLAGGRRDVMHDYRRQPVLRCHDVIAPLLAEQFAMPPTDRVADAFLHC